MRDLSFFPGLYVPPNKKAGPSRGKKADRLLEYIRVSLCALRAVKSRNDGDSLELKVTVKWTKRGEMGDTSSSVLHFNKSFKLLHQMCLDGAVNLKLYPLLL